MQKRRPAQTFLSAKLRVSGQRADKEPTQPSGSTGRTCGRLRRLWLDDFGAQEELAEVIVLCSCARSVVHVFLISRRVSKNELFGWSRTKYSCYTRNIRTRSDIFWSFV